MSEAVDEAVHEAGVRSGEAGPCEHFAGHRGNSHAAVFGERGQGREGVFFE